MSPECRRSGHTGPSHIGTSAPALAGCLPCKNDATWIRDAGWFGRNDHSVAHALDRARSGVGGGVGESELEGVFINNLGRPVALRCATVAVVVNRVEIDLNRVTISKTLS